MIDVCCFQEVRGQCPGMLGMEERRYKLWWSGKGDAFGGDGVMVKEELCEKVVDVGRVRDGVVAVVLIFEEGVPRLICRYTLQNERCFLEKRLFMMS